jgi:hypothetical protein
MHKYIMLARPAAFSAMPPAIVKAGWEYAEAPAYVNRPDLPLSRHYHGVIVTPAKLTPAEAAEFDMREVGE